MCWTLCDPMDCSPPGSSVNGISPGKNTTGDCHALFQGILPTQGLNPGLSHYRQTLYHLSYPGSPTQLLVTTEMQIISSRRHYTSTRMAKLLKSRTPNVYKDAEQLELSCISGESVNWYNQFKKISNNFL